MSPSDYASRRQRIVEDIGQLKLDVLVVNGLPNIRYLTGFTGSNALLILGPGREILFTDPRYDIQARRETSCRVKVMRGSLYGAAAAHLRKLRKRRIGFERGRLTWAAYSELESGLPSGSWLRPAEAIVERRRVVKSAWEIECIRRAVHTNSLAFSRAVRRVHPPMTETDLAAEIEYQMRKNGAEKPSFETIVASGAASALPHARPGTTPLGLNRLLLIDMGATRDGYSSDMTRMLHLGAPGARARKLYAAVLEAQLAAVDSVRDGVAAGSVDRKARQVLRKHGLDRQFVHSTGHGLGLEIHEPPRVGRNEKTRLEAGMVITIEPGAYIENFGGVRIEDTVLVTKSGCEVLTPTPKELLVV